MFLTLAFVSALPSSHQLRFYIFIPLSWSAVIGMLFPEFRRRFPKSALGLLLVFAGLFVYVSDINRPYYRIERIGFLDVARARKAADWWPQLKSDRVYCAVGMEPIGFLLTGPTLFEFTFVDRKSASLCPIGATIIRRRSAKTKN